MKRTRPSEIKALLAERDILPSRVLGQNFLVDENILHIILDSAHLAAADRVLEIGPGLGVLTEHLLARGAHVVAIEKDPRLAAYVREAFAAHPGLTLLEGDALAFDLPGLLAREEITHLVSNLPYSSGTRMLVEMMDAPARPLRFVVMLQSDVAERLVAVPGSKAYGIISIHAQMYYEMVLRKSVSRSCFYPPPEVRSALVEGYRLPRPRTALEDAEHFRTFVKWCFSQRRKQLGTILNHAPDSLVGDRQAATSVFDRLPLQPDQRPESIPVPLWGELSNYFSSHSKKNPDYSLDSIDNSL
jgi:16S rRNA (adenine1518-N6/adenine1519-N6)-dimethyltransferase